MATHNVDLLNGSCYPDGGDAYFERYSVKATNDTWKHRVLILNKTTTRIGVHGVIKVPDIYVGSAKIIIDWTSTATSGDVEYDFDYRPITGDNSESLDQTTAAESVNLNDGAPTTAHNRMICTLNLTSSNIVGGDLLEYFLGRDGTDAGNTMAAAAIIHSANFNYSDA